jgi:hypothetical protein
MNNCIIINQVNIKLFISVSQIIGHNGPAIWRAERIETARWAVSAKEPASRKGILPES